MILLLALSSPANAHSGPPFPIVSSAKAGPYVISLWTDPDTTDDGSAGGQFWIVFEAAGSGAAPIPPETRATITVTPLDRKGTQRSATAQPVDGAITNQFAGVVLDHEGRFGVSVAIAGPAGTATLASEVDATYDMRPDPSLFVVYLLPFVLVGALWAKRLLMRRQFRVREREPAPPRAS